MDNFETVETISQLASHTRIFKANLNTGVYDMVGNYEYSLDDWVMQELEDGYVVKTLVGLVSDGNHIRVTTEYKPKTAMKHPIFGTSTENDDDSGEDSDSF